MHRNSIKIFFIFCVHAEDDLMLAFLQSYFLLLITVLLYKLCTCTCDELILANDIGWPIVGRYLISNSCDAMTGTTCMCTPLPPHWHNIQLLCVAHTVLLWFNPRLYCVICSVASCKAAQTLVQRQRWKCRTRSLWGDGTGWAAGMPAPGLRPWRTYARRSWGKWRPLGPYQHWCPRPPPREASQTAIWMTSSLTCSCSPNGAPLKTSGRDAFDFSGPSR